jgi:phosphatidate cytidylyltransferase
VSNLAQRVAVGVVAIPLILLLCMTGGVFFFVFVAAASAVALHEFYGLARAKAARPLTTLGLLSGFGINLSFFLSPDRLHPPLLVIVLIASVLGFGLCELFHNRGSALINLATTVLGVAYIPLFFGTLIGIRQLFTPAHFPTSLYYASGLSDPNPAATINRWGGYMTIAVFAVIWICDSAAFHVGVASGKHKLFPRVSPQKSWEGAIAGFVFAILAALGAKFVALPFLPITGAIFVGVIVGTIGQMGDLAESLLKRDAGVKDSSNLIPGHGGAFDRFDSVLMVSPCVYLYLSWLFHG